MLVSGFGSSVYMPFGGGGRVSTGEKTPLMRDICLGPVVEEAGVVDGVKVEALEAESVVYCRVDPVLLEGRTSTINSESLASVRPCSIFCASAAPAWDRNCKTAEMKPGSLDWSWGSSSISTSCWEKTAMSRTDSFEVLRGKRRIKTGYKGEAGRGKWALPDLGASRIVDA